MSGSRPLPRAAAVIEPSWELPCPGALKAGEQQENTREGARGRPRRGASASSRPPLSLLTCSGVLGERLPIRYYLASGMLASGAFTALFGLGYFYDIHSFGFYVVTQVRSGPVARRVRGAPR